MFCFSHFFPKPLTNVDFHRAFCRDRPSHHNDRPQKIPDGVAGALRTGTVPHISVKSSTKTGRQFVFRLVPTRITWLKYTWMNVCGLWKELGKTCILHEPMTFMTQVLYTIGSFILFHTTLRRSYRPSNSWITFILTCKVLLGASLKGSDLIQSVSATSLKGVCYFIYL